jgi:hypothetical protein
MAQHAVVVGGWVDRIGCVCGDGSGCGCSVIEAY